MSRRASRRFDCVAVQADDGFSLIEVIVALTILVVVMLGSAGFFISSLKRTSTLSQRQTAVTLASQMLEYTRSVPPGALVQGRMKEAVDGLLADRGTANLSNEITTTTSGSGNSDSDTTHTSQVVPISSTPTVNSVAFTVRTYIDRCYFTTDLPSVCGGTTTNATVNNWMYRVTVGVRWDQKAGQKCSTSSGQCEYDASALIDNQKNPCFNSTASSVACPNVGSSTSTPLITSITPATVTRGTTAVLTIGGSGFLSGATMSIDSGGTLSGVTFDSATQMRVTLAASNTATAGTHTITLTNPDGVIAMGTFTIAASTPSITSVTPSSVITGSTTTFTIAGSGFLSGATVGVDAAAGTINSTTYNSSTSIQVVLAAKSGSGAAGTHTFTVTNPDGSTSTGTFTIGLSSPAVTSVSPSTVNNGATTTLTIAGSGFVSGAVVTVDSGAGTVGSTTYTSATSLSVVLTAKSGSIANGSHTVTVTNPDGKTATGTFSISAAAVALTGVSPAPVPTGGARTVTLTGSGFATGISVSVDSGTLGTVTYNSATSLTVTYTPGTTGTHTFTVTNTDGGVASKTFTVVTPPTVTSVTFSPSTAYSTSTVTLNGTGFVSGATVRAQGSGYDVSPTVTYVSSTKLTFSTQLPGAGTYSFTFTVTNPDGGVGSKTQTITVS